MGIQGFASRMQGYGTRKVIGPTKDPNTPTLAVIDGPALAHSIYQNLCDRHRGIDLLELNYSYIHLGEAVVSWLEHLENSGFLVEGVYFDGALPSYKVATRISRVRNHFASLVRYKGLWERASATKRIGRVKKRHRQNSLASLHEVRTARGCLAPPAFLVSAVTEALLDSQFSERTFVVPGEADAFCAAAALRNSRDEDNREITIFTNDSDLIVYNSGAKTRVVLINSIEESTDTDGLSVLHGLEFWPTELAKRLDPTCVDLINIAFQMQDSSVSFEQARKAWHSTQEHPSLSQFTKEYNTTKATTYLRILKTNTEEHKATSVVDSRVSEFVVTVLHMSEKAKTTSQHRKRANDPNSRTCTVNAYEMVCNDIQTFLPTLFEDPARRCAWHFGQVFRNLAINIALKHYHLDCKVKELMRSGTEVKLVEIGIEHDDLLNEQLADWTTYLGTQLQELDYPNQPVQQWSLVLRKLVLTEIINEGLSLPKTDDIVKILSGRGAHSWDAGHLAAQFQAEYYSLRMLKQVSRFVVLNMPSTTTTTITTRAILLDGLLRALSDLPSISALWKHETEPNNCKWQISSENLWKEFNDTKETHTLQ